MRTSEYHDRGAHRPFVYVLGTSGPAVSTFVDAVESCLHDLESKLAGVGCVLNDVVNVRAYLPSFQMTIPGYAEYNEVYNRFFHAHGIFQKPARATVGIDPLQRVVVMMEAFALRATERQARIADDAHARLQQPRLG